MLQEITESNSGNALDFDGFLRELTNRIVYLLLYGEIHSLRKVGRLTSTS